LNHLYLRLVRLHQLEGEACGHPVFPDRAADLAQLVQSFGGYDIMVGLVNEVLQLREYVYPELERDEEEVGVEHDRTRGHDGLGWLSHIKLQAPVAAGEGAFGLTVWEMMN